MRRTTLVDQDLKRPREKYSVRCLNISTTIKKQKETILIVKPSFLSNNVPTEKEMENISKLVEVKKLSLIFSLIPCADQSVYIAQTIMEHKDDIHKFMIQESFPRRLSLNVFSLITVSSICTLFIDINTTFCSSTYLDKLLTYSDTLSKVVITVSDLRHNFLLSCRDFKNVKLLIQRKHAVHHYFRGFMKFLYFLSPSILSNLTVIDHIQAPSSNEHKSKRLYIQNFLGNFCKKRDPENLVLCRNNLRTQSEHLMLKFCFQRGMIKVHRKKLGKRNKKSSRRLNKGSSRSVLPSKSGVL